MNISFIIPLYNEETTICRCIGAIAAQMCSDDEIIVVDNGSTDSSLQNIRMISTISVIEKLGVTIAAVRNTGAGIARNEVLAFIDADCVVSPQWRAAVVDALSDQTVSATGSKVDIPEDAVWIEKAWYAQRITSRCSVKYINSGNFVVRRSVFQEVGGFSESLKTGEDSELGWRINKAGYKILSHPGIRSVHLGNPKTIKNFYMKEKWHALGMMGTFKISCLDKPLLMTAAFFVCNLLALFFLVVLGARGNITYGLVGFLALTASVPVTTAIYRVIQFKTAQYLFTLICLYWVYFVARANVLLSIGYNKYRTH